MFYLPFIALCLLAYCVVDSRYLPQQTRNASRMGDLDVEVYSFVQVLDGKGREYGQSNYLLRFSLYYCVAVEV